MAPRSSAAEIIGASPGLAQKTWSRRCLSASPASRTSSSTSPGLSIAPTPAQVRAQVAAVLEKATDARVIGVRAPLGMALGDTLRLDGRELRVSRTDSVLALREQLDALPEGAPPLVLLTTLDESELGSWSRSASAPAGSRRSSSNAMPGWRAPCWKWSRPRAFRRRRADSSRRSWCGASCSTRCSGSAPMSTTRKPGSSGRWRRRTPAAPRR